MRLHIEVHVPANAGIVTGVVCDLDTGLSALFARDRDGRWIALAGAERNKNVVVADGHHSLLPIEIEGGLNRAHNLAAQRAKVARSHSTVAV